ncbi:MAG: GtrA family protein [Clostridia bacterium]|nr:GtrA family protein [Clostridia bacterium]
MKEFFEIIFSFNLKKIFCEPTRNGLLQFFRYAFVGLWATLADWAMMFSMTEGLKVHYLLSGIVAFVMGLTVNFLLSKKFVFSGEEKQHSSSTEFAVYAIIGVIGLGLTELIMYVLTGRLKIYFMLSKIIATGVVFVWNFAARKIVLYR